MLKLYFLNLLLIKFYYYLFKKIKISLNYFNFKFNKFKLKFGDWELGIGDWGLGPIPNPQSPSPINKQN